MNKTDKSKPIYVITVTGKRSNEPSDIPYLSRKIGWGHTLKEAQEYVECNRCDLHECYYTYAVIEETNSGVFCRVTKEYWYKWNRTKGKWNTGEWKRIEKPKEFAQICNFGLG